MSELNAENNTVASRRSRVPGVRMMISGVEALSVPPQDKPRLAATNIQSLREAIKKARDVEASVELLRLRNHRDKGIAHAILWAAREKGGPIDLPTSCDADKLLQGTIEIMSTVASVARLTYEDFRDELAEERARADNFFAHLGLALRTAAEKCL